MPYESVFTKTFEKHLKRIKKSGKWEQVRKKIEDILDRPEQVGEDKSQILKGCRAAKMGHHVIVWKVVREVVYFLACDEHDDAYLAAQKEARERWKAE